MSHPDPSHPRASARTLRPGADPWPIVQSLLMQMDALSATALMLVNCFQTGSPEPEGRRAPRTFGRHNASPTPAASDATATGSPDTPDRE